MAKNKLMNLLLFLFAGLNLLILAGFTSCQKPKPLAEIERVRKDTKLRRISERKNKVTQKLKEGKSLAWELKEYLRKNPNDIEANYALADAYRNEGRFADAANLYKLCYIFSHDKNRESDPLLEKELAERQENARYCEVFCRNATTSSIHNTCDLSPLEDVIQLCDRFVRDYPTSEKISDVSSIKGHCYKRLLCKTQSIFNQYCDNWYAKEMNKYEKHLAESEKLAAQKILDKMKQTFDISHPEIAPLIAFSEYKLARTAYKIAEAHKAEAAKLSSKRTVPADTLAKLDEAARDAKSALADHLNNMTQSFAATKETKAALAMARGVIDLNELPLEKNFGEKEILG